MNISHITAGLYNRIPYTFAVPLASTWSRPTQGTHTRIPARPTRVGAHTCSCEVIRGTGAGLGWPTRVGAHTCSCEVIRGTGAGLGWPTRVGGASLANWAKEYETNANYKFRECEYILMIRISHVPFLFVLKEKYIFTNIPLWNSRFTIFPTVI